MAYTTIDDSSAHFQIALHSSSNSATITNDGNSDLKPDLLWSKARGAGHSHGLFDSSRGVRQWLRSDTDNAEVTVASGYDLISFNTDGFSTGNNQYNTICGNTTYVAWQWKANGGTTSSNTSGNITSTVQANQDAGFSIVSFTGNGTDGATVGHGLGAVPAMVLFKCRDTSNTDWRVYHQSISPTNAVSLNSSGAQYGASGVFGGTFTSTLLKVENDTGANRNTSPMIAYCFAEKQGYSRFGSYVGNGQTQEGPFVYTGFKPAFVMIKNTETASRNWYIYDIKRRAFNSNGSVLSANVANAEADDQAIDIFSNGFRVRPEGVVSGYGTSTVNHNSQKFIYAAWAENPFVTSTGVPGTAL